MVKILLLTLIAVLLSLGLATGCGSTEPVLEIDADCLDRQESSEMGEVDLYMMCSNAVEICPSLEMNVLCPDLAQGGAVVRREGTVYVCPSVAFSGLVARYDRCSILGTY